MNNCLRIALWFLFLAFSKDSIGAPTRRPLPADIRGDHPRIINLRDHEDARRFHFLPKVYDVTENSLVAFGDQETGCEAVSQYEQAIKMVITAKNEHIKATVTRLRTLNDMLTDLEQLRKEQLRLLTKKREIETELKDLDVATESGKKRELSLKKELELTDRLLKTFDDKVKSAEQLRVAAEKEQTEGLAQIEKLEKSLASFEDRVTKAAGRVTIRLRLPSEFLSDDVLRKEAGLQTADQHGNARYVGLSLYPEKDEDLGYKEKIAKASALGSFQPEWSVKSQNAPSTIFGGQEIPVTLEEQPLEKELAFTSLVSLYAYCALRKNYDSHRLKQTLVPLRVGYTFALWKSPPIVVARSEIARYTISLEPEAWTVVSKLSSASGAIAVAKEDTGHPRRFSNKGFYEPLSLNVSLNLALDKKEK